MRRIGVRILPHQCPLPGERVPEFSRAGVGKRCDFTMNHPTSVSYADSFYPSRGEAIKHPFGVPIVRLYPHYLALSLGRGCPVGAGVGRVMLSDSFPTSVSSADTFSPGRRLGTISDTRRTNQASPFVLANSVSLFIRKRMKSAHFIARPLHRKSASLSLR